MTARIGEAQTLPLIADLCQAVAQLDGGKRQRASVQVYGDDVVWEIGLENDGEAVLLTLLRSAPTAEVAIYERRLDRREFRAALARTVAEALSRPQRAENARRTLQLAERAIAEPTAASASPAPRSDTEISARASGGIRLRARVPLRSAAEDLAPSSAVERADLLALLARGPVELSVRSRCVPLGDTHVFLLAERLVALADDVVDAAMSGRACFRRVELGTLRIGVQRGPGAPNLSLLVGPPGKDRVTFPALDALHLAKSVVRFARSLCDAMMLADPAARSNLRLTNLRRNAAMLERRANDQEGGDEPVENQEPESYRSLAVPRRSESTGRWSHGGKMRFVPRWVATIPSIDLRATFLCGDRLIAGSERETACIHRTTGALLWRMPSPRAASVATPAGLARLYADGRVMLHDLSTGEVRFEAQVAPRAGGGATGAVVNSAGLPRLLVLSEGDRRISALDLVGGEIRWRFTARRPGAYKVRRAGGLLLVSGGDRNLTALEVKNGEVVWRLRAEAPLSTEVTVDHDAAYAVASDGSSATLICVDPFSGAMRWQSEIDERVAPGQSVIVTRDAVVVPLRDRRGSGLAGYCRQSGARLWQHEPGLASPVVAWLGVDADVIGNSAAGTLLCLGGKDGHVRYSHAFPRHVDADQPRRLEPVLRSGALFVPQQQVHVVRPRDGETLGVVPTDLIPDLLRVDERCDVYVAEESGHVAAFGAAARLTLVKG
ncbi:MAG: PQQ-binding-like beta-propeller repeat protein [Polyangiaceae bacterium]